MRSFHAFKRSWKIRPASDNNHCLDLRPPWAELAKDVVQFWLLWYPQELWIASDHLYPWCSWISKRAWCNKNDSWPFIALRWNVKRIAPKATTVSTSKRIKWQTEARVWRCTLDERSSLIAIDKISPDLRKTETCRKGGEKGQYQ